MEETITYRPMQLQHMCLWPLTGISKYVFSRWRFVSYTMAFLQRSREIFTHFTWSFPTLLLFMTNFSLTNTLAQPTSTNALTLFGGQKQSPAPKLASMFYCWIDGKSLLEQWAPRFGRIPYSRQKQSGLNRRPFYLRIKLREWDVPHLFFQPLIYRFFTFKWMHGFYHIR